MGNCHWALCDFVTMAIASSVDREFPGCGGPTDVMPKSPDACEPAPT
jgi:hypothetical protein